MQFRFRVVMCLAVALCATHVAPASSWADTFVATGAMNVPRSNHCAVLLANGKVLIVGGYSDNLAQNPTNVAELYDPSTGVFTVTGSLAVARYNTTATLLLDGRVLVAGGITPSGVTATAELYDPVSGTFSPTGSMNASRNTFSANLLPNGKVLVAGGYNFSSSWLASAELYDPASGTFSPTGSLIAARYGHLGTSLLSGDVLISSGNSFGAYSGVLERYNVQTGTFQNAGSMTARGGMVSALLPDGDVLLAGGGLPSGGGNTTLAQVWNPLDSSTTTIASLNGAHSASASAVLSSGQVLIAGGFGLAGTILTSAETFDPTTGLFTNAGSMGTARYAATATRLSDDRVLIAGGATRNGNPDYAPTASSELFVNDVDTTAPVLSLPSPITAVAASGSGVVVTYAVSASDPDDVVGTATCAPASGSTFPLGTTTVDCSATDSHGNTGYGSFTVTVSYRVCTLYNTAQAFRSGSTIPVKLQLCTADGVNISAPAVMLTATRLVYTSASVSAAVQDAGNANPDSNFRYDATLGGAGGYIFNLQTKGLLSGTYSLEFTISGDPAPHSTPFQIK